MQAKKTSAKITPTTVKLIRQGALFVLALITLLILTFSKSCYFYIGKQVVGEGQKPLVGIERPRDEAEKKSLTQPKPTPEQLKPDMYYVIPVSPSTKQSADSYS